ncbi:hypothetical protein ACS0PU_010412 [Formica fusca]
MDVAIKKQMITAGYVERFWENLCKVRKEKMTKLYLNTRLELLEPYWTLFLEAHDVILSFERIETSDYLKQDVYVTTENNSPQVPQPQFRLSDEGLRVDTLEVSYY